MRKKVYKIIKKQNGEAFAKAIRNFDERIFDIPNLPGIVQYAGRQSEGLLFFLSSLIENKEEEIAIEPSNPFKLLSEAGYVAFYANSLKKQNSIRSYFAEGEELCTFKDCERYKKYYIIHCVKRNADKLKRKDFTNPNRQDEYGTSVISIQILRQGGFIKITNRYNHTIDDPDNTFNSNPDAIIRGLTVSLKKYFDVDFDVKKTDLPAGYLYQNGCIYKYHTENDNVYYGSDYYLKDGKIYKINKDYQFLVGPCLFDLKEGKVTDLITDNPYVDVLNKEMAGKKIERRKEPDGFSLYLDGKKFITIREDARKGYVIDWITLYETEHLPDKTWYRVGFSKDGIFDDVREFHAPKLKSIGKRCCNYSKMVIFDAPLLERTGQTCLCYCEDLQELILPNLTELGIFNLFYNGARRIYLPKLEVLSEGSLQEAKKLKVLILPSLKRIKSESMRGLESLQRIVAPHIEVIEKGSVQYNNALERLYFPQLKKVFESAISYNKNLKRIFAPRLVEILDFSIVQNASTLSLEAPLLERVGRSSLEGVNHLYAPRVQSLKGVPFIRRLWLNLGLRVKNDERFKNAFGLLNLYRSYVKE